MIEDLKIDGSPSPKSFPINVSTLENLRAIRVKLRHDLFVEGFLRPFRPDSGEGDILCQSLQGSSVSTKNPWANLRSHRISGTRKEAGGH